MKKSGILATIIVVIGVLLIGVIVFSSNGLSVQGSPSLACKFENLNQKIEFDGLSGRSGEGIRNYTRTLHVPSDKSYSDVKVSSGRIYGGCSQSDPCSLWINGVFCIENFESGGNFFIEHDLPTECTDAIVKGANNITLVNDVIPSGSIGSIFLEMRVRPANC